jgi:hypothetical protein
MNSKINFIAIFFLFFIHENATAGLDDISPHVACNLLTHIGLTTQGWQHYYDDEYGCKSISLAFGPPNYFRNNLSFHVEGTSGTVKEMVLLLNINNIIDAAEAHHLFLQVAQELLMKLRNEPMPDNMVDAILHGKNYSFITDNIHVKIHHSYWIMKSKKLDAMISKGYEVTLILN